MRCVIFLIWNFFLAFTKKLCIVKIPIISRDTKVLLFDLGRSSSGNYTLPSVFEPNNDKYQEFVDLKYDFMTYDSSTREIKFENMIPGTYKINIKVIDEY